MPTNHKDLPSKLILEMANKFIKNGHDVYFKWTCPRCGERCVSDGKNTFALGGYTHTTKKDGTPCGETYTGDLFGLQAVIHFDPPDPHKRE